MFKRSLALLSIIAIASTFLSPAKAVVVAPNPWLSDGRSPLNIAHQGGEIEHPSNTMYAFKESMRKGADVLELDVHATKDQQIVVIHDPKVNRTTGGSGRVDALTLAEIKLLDAAYWFVPDVGTINCHSEYTPSQYSWRGVASGQVPPPTGYSANDFKIPTLREVLVEFPNVLINIEIKNTAPDTAPYEKLLADLLAEFGRDDDVIIVSFLDNAIEAFKLFAPNVHTATATGETAVFWASAQGPGPGLANPRYVALQVPIAFNGVTVIDEAGKFIAKANASGLAVHAWTINTRVEMEWLLAAGVQGIMTDRPSLLEQILTERGTPTP